MAPDRREPAQPPVYLVGHPGAEMFGADRMMLESVAGFRADGAEVIVALPGEGPLADALRAEGAEVFVGPMLVLRKSLLHPREWPRALVVAVRGAFACWRLIARHRPDAIYVSTITIPLFPVIAAIRRVPVLTHVHEAEASGSKLLNTAMYAPHLLARSVVVNSAFSIRTISEALPAVARGAQLVYNGVAGPDVPQPPRPDLSDLRILYVGRLSPRKGVEDVIAAAELLHQEGRRVSVSLLGSAFAGYEWFEDRVRDIATSSPVNVQLLGFRADVWPVVAAHDVLVVPSRVDEPFGNTAVEGILAQRPVVATDTGGLVEAVGDYPTAFLALPSNPPALASAVKTVIDSWGLITAAVSLSADRARQRHAPERYRRRMAEEMQRIVVNS